MTSLSMLLAEELECDWNKIRTEFPRRRPRVRTYQGVVGSHEHPHFLGAAAQGRRHRARDADRRPRRRQWGVDKSQCRAENGSVVNTATNATLELRQPGRSGCEAACSRQRHAERPEPVPPHRQIR